MSTLQDMKTSLEDARFFYERIELMIRRPQEDLEVVRRYFRAYLHCWKCILHYIRTAKGLGGKKKYEKAWIAWCNRWQKKSLDTNERKIFEYLRETRDDDIHKGIIYVDGIGAAGLNPTVIFHPNKTSIRPTELISCCKRGLVVADRLIQDYPNVR